MSERTRWLSTLRATNPPPARPISVSSTAVLALVLAFLSTLGATSAAQAQTVGKEIAEIDLSRWSIGSQNNAIVDISITSQRAIDGKLVVTNQTADGIVYEYPINLSAQSTGVQTVAVSSPFGDISLDVDLVENDRVLASNQLQANALGQGTNTAVAVFGFEQTDTETDLAVGDIKASFFPVEDLHTIGAYDTVVAEPSAVRELNQQEQKLLTSWVSIGGQLLIAGESGSIDQQLPESWTTDSQTRIADSGVIRYVGSDWEQQVTPGLNSVTGQEQFDYYDEGFNTEIFADAEIKLPPLGWLIATLLLYVMLVGPVLYLVLRISKKSILMWAIMPAAAVLASGAVLLVGSQLLSSRTSVHTSIIEVTPSGAYATSTVLLTERGEQRLVAPAGWTAEANNSGEYYDTRDASIRPVLEPRRDETTATLNVSNGNVGLLRMHGPVDEYVGALTIEVEQVTNDEITGSVTNNSGTNLTNSVVGTDQHAVRIGAISDGETVTFALQTDVDQQASPQDSVELGLWPNNNDTVNKSRWSNLRSSREGTLTGAGTVMVAGWTTELASPLGPEKGRTALVARTSLANWDQTRHGIRSSRVPIPGDEGYDTQIRQFIRTSETPTMAVRSLAESNVEVWSGNTWEPLTDGQPGGSITSLSEDLWLNDTLYLREQFFENPRFVTDLVPDDGTATAPDNVQRVSNEIDEDLDQEFGHYSSQPPLPPGSSDRYLIQRPSDVTYRFSVYPYSDAALSAQWYVVQDGEETALPDTFGGNPGGFDFDFSLTENTSYILEVTNTSSFESGYDLEVSE